MDSERFSLKRPIPIGDAQWDRYTMNGLVFTPRTGEGYTHLQTPYPINEADFASLSPDDLYNLSPYFSNDEHKPLIEEAKRIQLLRMQSTTVHKDGFPHPSEEKPFTWPLNEQARDEIGGQLETLRQLGIFEVKLGLEMEFSCPEDAIAGFSYWEEIKRNALSQLLSSLNSASSDLERKNIEDKMSQVSQFNAREMLMYDLIELDKRTRDLLEPLFGTGRDGDGYYDAEGVLELKMRPVDAQTALDNRIIILNAIYEKAASYGLELEGAPGMHINISFWDEKGNVLDDSHPEFLTKGKAVAEGLTKGIYDGVFVLLSEREMRSEKLIPLELVTNRDTLLRFSSGRIEIRPTVDNHLQHPELMVATALAGVEGRLSSPQGKDVIPAIEVVSPIVHHSKDMHKVMSHVLGNSIINEEGFLEIPEGYVKDHIETLEYELGIVDRPPELSYWTALAKIFHSSDYLPYVTDFLAQVKIVQDDDENLNLQFPSNVDGGYEFIIPAFNMDKLPVDMQRRLEAGEEIPNEEYGSYLKIGESYPRPAKKVIIDTEKLSESLRVAGTQSKFVITGYDLNATDYVYSTPEGWNTEAWARYLRLTNSDCLAQGFSPEFFNSLREFSSEACKNEPPRTIERLSEAEIQEKLFFKVEDRDWHVWTASEEERVVLEGVEFRAQEILIRFEDLDDADSFILNITNILDKINKKYSTSYWHKCIEFAYLGGKFDVQIEIEPELLPLLEKEVEGSKKS